MIFFTYYCIIQIQSLQCTLLICNAAFYPEIRHFPDVLTWLDKGHEFRVLLGGGGGFCSKLPAMLLSIEFVSWPFSRPSPSFILFWSCSVAEERWIKSEGAHGGHSAAPRYAAAAKRSHACSPCGLHYTSDLCPRYMTLSIVGQRF